MLLVELGMSSRSSEFTRSLTTDCSEMMSLCKCSPIVVLVVVVVVVVVAVMLVVVVVVVVVVV